MEGKALESVLSNAVDVDLEEQEEGSFLWPSMGGGLADLREPHRGQVSLQFLLSQSLIVKEPGKLTRRAAKGGVNTPQRRVSSP